MHLFEPDRAEALSEGGKVKRGLIAWDLAELPRAAFEARLDIVKRKLVEKDLPALVVHTDIWKSNQARYLSNVMLYWNRALLVIPCEGAPVLLCGLSPRVYPWIRSVTILEDIRPGANLVQALQQLCGERNWTRLGALDFLQFSHDLYAQLSASAIETVDIHLSERPDSWELAMYRTAVGMARRILEEAVPHGVGLTDFQFTGELELHFRRAGAEDLVALLTNGQTPPLLAKGVTLDAGFSAAVAFEYRGHWVKVARSNGPVGQRFEEAIRDASAIVEILSGAYPYESCKLSDVEPGSLFALHVESKENGRRVFYGDTCLKTESGAELL
jgi:hypothetical protein